VAVVSLVVAVTVAAVEDVTAGGFPEVFTLLVALGF